MSLLTFPWSQLLDANGDPYPGAKMYFYQTGTSTLASVYTDSDNLVAHTNPVVANAQGVFPPIYLGNREYKVTLTTAADVVLYTADPVANVETYVQSNAVQLTGAQTVDGYKTFIGGVGIDTNAGPLLIEGRGWNVAALNNNYFVTYNGTTGGPDGATSHAGFGFGAAGGESVTLAGRDSRFYLRTGTTGTTTYEPWHEIYHTGNFDPTGTVSPDLNDTWVPTAYTGFSANPSMTFWYRKVGNVVSMRIGNTTYGTTNGANITIGTLPAAIRPTFGRIVDVPALVQTSSFGNMRATAQLVITTSGTLEIWNPISITDGGNNYPRYVQTSISGRTWTLDNSPNFTYTI